VSTSLWALVPVAITIAGKLLQGIRLRRARARIPLVIHVNGTRGKTQTTKLITHILRAHGMRAMGKVTGDQPRLIECDGTVTRIRRRTPPSIAEQAWTIRQAARRGAEALVVECMAIRPELQNVSERSILRSDIGVLTNVRPDHLDVQGRSMPRIAESLCAGIPYDAIVFTAEKEQFERLERTAHGRRTRLVLVRPHDEAALGRNHLYPENEALALAVCEHIGIDRTSAQQAIETFQDGDADTLTIRVCSQGKTVTVVNALSANDPVSTRMRWEEETNRLGGDAPWIGLYCHRRDRSFRARLFGPMAMECGFDRCLLAGDRVFRSRQTFPGGVDLSGTSRAEPLWARISEHAEDGAVVFAFGNRGGVGGRLVDYLRERGDVA